MDLYNLQFADLAHELDKINLNELTPIEALNILVKLKRKNSRIERNFAKTLDFCKICDIIAKL